MDWLVYYSDGSTFSSEDGAWEDAPGRDVQVVLFRDPERGWMLRHGGNAKHADFFRMDEDGSVVGMDLPGMIDHVCYELGVVKQGRMLSQDHWESVLKAAMERKAELEIATAPRAGASQ